MSNELNEAINAVNEKAVITAIDNLVDQSQLHMALYAAVVLRDSDAENMKLLSIIRALVSRGAEINSSVKQDNLYYTPLSYALGINSSGKIMGKGQFLHDYLLPLLLKLGAYPNGIQTLDPNMKGRYYRPMTYAIQDTGFIKSDIPTLLFQHGASFNGFEGDTITPLYMLIIFVITMC